MAAARSGHDGRGAVAFLLCALCLLAGPAAGDGVPGRGRAELHVHFDGSIDVDALFRICVSRGLLLPTQGRGQALPDSAADVESYIKSHPGWHRFDAVNEIVGGSVQTVRQAAEAFVDFQAAAGVTYTEVRYDPVRLSRSSLANASISEVDVVRAVQAGLAAGAQKHGVAVFQLLCAMRGQPAARCFDVATLAARLQSRDMGGVVGMDIAGDESTYPNTAYVQCFRHAKLGLGLKTTVHSGEFNDTSADEVRVAVEEMLADRVGHGYAAVRDPAVMTMLKERNVHVEACPASAKSHGHWALSAIGAFREQGLNFGLNTDDPVSFIGNTSAAADERIVELDLGFSQQDVERAYDAARAAAFGVVPVADGQLYV